MTAPRPMARAQIRRLMTREWTPPAGSTEAEQADGNPMDPAIAWVLLQCREAIAEATCEAILALRALGVDGEGGEEMVRRWGRRI